jgi:hypothetical protein
MTCRNAEDKYVILFKIPKRELLLNGWEERLTSDIIFT